MICPVDVAPHDVESPPPSTDCDCCLVGTHEACESCPSGQRRGPAAPGGDKVPSPGHKFFHTYTTQTNRGRKRRSLWFIPPRTVWRPPPHPLITDWLGLKEPVRCEILPWGQRGSLATPGEDRVSSPDQEDFHTYANPTNRGRKQ